jgi:hypothetical protein
MDDLLCTDPAAYKARAINLGQSRNDLNSCKQRLIQKRDICPLFDTPALVHHLEALFQHMWTEACEGRTPVPDLTNLDTYFTAGISGATATPAAPQPTSRTALIAFYKDQIANLRATMHVPVDTRLDTAAD